MKNIRRFILTFTGLVIAAAIFYFAWLSPRYTVPILMYHRFGCGNNTLFVTPENFDRQMRYLKNKNYDVISLDDLVRGINSKKKFHHNTVVITVDDGYKDNFIYAYPVLKKYGFNATIFLVSGFIGTKEEFMNWEDVRTMLKDNISFGGHTRSHVYLPSARPKEVLLDEIAGAKQEIEKNTNTAAAYFCYPSGGFNEEVKKIVKEAGYNGACATNRGFSRFNQDVYELKRVKIADSDTSRPFSFWAKLSGYYNVFRPAKKSE